MNTLTVVKKGKKHDGTVHDPIVDHQKVPVTYFDMICVYFDKVKDLKDAALSLFVNRSSSLSSQTPPKA